MLETLKEISLAWYELMSRWGYGLGGPVGEWALRLNLPLFSAFLFGLVGSLAPCQVSANSGAIAYVVSRSGGGRAAMWRESLGYLLGKVAVYSLLGGAAILVGVRLPTPLMAVLRKALGPMMVIFGLYLLGALRLRFSIGTRAGAWLEQRLPGRAGAGAFALGSAYSLSFCPTMAILFFGLLVPMGLRAPLPVGVVLPSLFAVGTAVPLLFVTGVVALGVGVRPDWVHRLRRWDRYLRAGSGLVFLIAGLNDSFLYWLI